MLAKYMIITSMEFDDNDTSYNETHNIEYIASEIGKLLGTNAHLLRPLFNM